MLVQYYLEKLDYLNMPSFFIKYLKCPTLTRLKKVGYFCGMDYASKDIYKFSEYISRFDHSLTVCLLVYKLTNDKIAALAGLFHDVATPCFSHVIDYMNEDYEKQESTEEYTEKIIKKDESLMKCLIEDNIDINNIINFKNFTIVDNNRPKLCADRLDGVILTGIGWTKNINKNDIDIILSDVRIFKNESDEYEIGFSSLEVAKKIMDVSESIDEYCHSNEDNYMMQLLANITKFAIRKRYILYDDLYTYNEDQLMELFKKISDKKFQKLLNEFENIKKEYIPIIQLSNVKKRNINPLVNSRRLI